MPVSEEAMEPEEGKQDELATIRERLAEPFPSKDIEWRVHKQDYSASNGGVWCRVLAYVTARAIQERLDEVVGPENWRNEEPRVISVNGKSAFACGLSLRINGEWLTKWDVSEPTNIEPAKGGWSGAMKRAGAMWGIARYLYYLEDEFAECQEKTKPQGREWRKGKLKDRNIEFWWKPPELPGWALPKDEQTKITYQELVKLKVEWTARAAPNITNRAELSAAFDRFIVSAIGTFPSQDYRAWDRDSWQKCMDRVMKIDPDNPDSEVPFE